MKPITDYLYFKLNHRARSLVLIGLLVLVCTFFIITFSRTQPEYTISRIFINQDRFDSLTKYNVAEDSPITTELYIEDEKLIYDAVENCFYFSYTDGDDFGKQTLYVDTQNYSYKEALLGNYIHAAILNNENPKLVLYTKDRISVSDFVITTLPIININISAETVEELKLDETYNIEEYAPGSMTLYDNRTDFDLAKRTITSDIKIHRRGGTTIDFPQKSYRVTLLDSTDNFGKTKKANLLGLREDDDWILYSAYSDYEKIRTPFSMNLWKEMSSGNNEWGASVSNEYKYIELFFNGRYHGLYTLTYPLDNKSFSIGEGETLFKKSDWSETEYSLDLEPFEDDTDLLWLPGYTVKEGSDVSYSILHQLYYNMAYSPDPGTIRESIDIDNSIDLWLFYKITQAVDNIYGTGVKNLFTATKLSDSGDEGYKLLFAPWDMDQTWGNRYVDGEGRHGISSYYNPVDYDLPMDWGTVPFLMAAGDTEIVQEIKDRYHQLRETVLSDASLSEDIAKYESDIYDSGAFQRTINRWPDGNYYDPQVKLDGFENYVLARMKYMDTYIDSLQ